MKKNKARQPYADIQDYCYWSRAVTRVFPGRLDPVTRATPIDTQAKIATMGSCFAQHISRHLVSNGFRFYIAEKSPDELTPQQAAALNYNVYSARYGNIYTVRQAVQLFDRAYGLFEPQEAVWSYRDRFVDAFRPTITPGGYASPRQVLDEAQAHFPYVREVFEKSDWLVFTLGLTEAWTSRHDAAVYPVAPGVSGGNYDPEHYRFVNFSVMDVIGDLTLFLEKVRSVNPTIRFLLTVSPVPLIATYEDRHVLVSTTYSKSVLCTAAHEMEHRFEHCYYFPSYDIITSPIIQGRYFNDDLRTITTAGVTHVMQLFQKHFLKQNDSPETVGTGLVEADPEETICDEELIEQALVDSGLQRR